MYTKSCIPRRVQFGQGYESAVYSPPFQWFLGKALVDVQEVKSLEAVECLFLKGPNLTQTLFCFLKEPSSTKETKSFYVFLQ